MQSGDSFNCFPALGVVFNLRRSLEPKAEISSVRLREGGVAQSSISFTPVINGRQSFEGRAKLSGLDLF
ncbi:MAG TPA: hypothetical protein VI837_11075, partial [Blastocatellia bacterium]|nr:hypothetical protein [Blastocatellia bacterium]